MPTVQTIVSFPTIKVEDLEEDSFQKCLGKLIKENSSKLYEHFNDSSASYYYPLVQYKIIDGMPILLGYSEGADLLDKFLKKVREVYFEGILYPILDANIKQARLSINPTGVMNRYEFKTLWLALNDKNFSIYNKLSEEERKDLLDKTLQNNIISCLKGLNYYATERITASTKLVEQRTQFKGKKMLGFSGEFETNAILPEWIGLGRSVDHGFGTVHKL